jgi:hypothetical protein
MKIITTTDKLGRKFSAEDLTGQVFGRLTVVRVSDKRSCLKGGSNRLQWECKCECGADVLVCRNNIISGRSKSCGCYRDDRRRLLGDEGSFRQWFMQYKTNARSRKLEFSLSKDDFREVTNKSCTYCKAQPKPLYASNRKTESIPYFCNGIDRVDNEKGYIPGNCVPCCSLCNYMKRGLSVEKFLTHVRAIALNNEENSNREQYNQVAIYSGIRKNLP